jgi:hypothetical protein
MPITFDSLEELKAFSKAFKLTNARGVKEAGLSLEAAAPKKRGRKPKAAQATTEAPKKRGRKPKAAKLAEVAVKGKRGRKPGSTNKTTVKGMAKSTAPKAKRVRTGETLTVKIQNAIQNKIQGKQEFTANDIFKMLSTKDPSVNKQSVVTSVLKQMNSTFATIPVGEKAGMGPRPVKVYRPA